MFQILKIFILCFLPCLTYAAINTTTDSSSLPLHIVADSSFIDYKNSISTYEGNVKVDQGDSHLTADRIVTKNNVHHKMEEAIAYGMKNLAVFVTTPKPGDDIINAKARIIKFYPIKSLVVLEKDVMVSQGKNNFHGPMIIYNIKNQTINAPASKSGQATIVIEPDKIQ